MKSSCGRVDEDRLDSFGGDLLIAVSRCRQGYDIGSQ